MVGAPLVPRIDHEKGVLLGGQHIGIAREEQVLGDLRPGLGAVGLCLLLGEEAIFWLIADPLLGVTLEALEESQLLNDLRGLSQGTDSILGDRFAVGRQEQGRLQYCQLAERLGGRRQAGVGPVVPVRGIRRPELAR